MHLPTHNQNPLARGEQRKRKRWKCQPERGEQRAKKNNNLLLPWLFSFSLKRTAVKTHRPFYHPAAPSFYYMRNQSTPLFDCADKIEQGSISLLRHRWLSSSGPPGRKMTLNGPARSSKTAHSSKLSPTNLKMLPPRVSQIAYIYSLCSDTPLFISPLFLSLQQFISLAFHLSRRRFILRLEFSDAATPWPFPLFYRLRQLWSSTVTRKTLCRAAGLFYCFNDFLC